jgi:hypothetical protein
MPRQIRRAFSSLPFAALAQRTADNPSLQLTLQELMRPAIGERGGGGVVVRHGLA